MAQYLIFIFRNMDQNDALIIHTQNIDPIAEREHIALVFQCHLSAKKS